MGAPLLAVQGLRTSIYLDEGVVRAVNGVSFTVERGQTMAIVGESGSGKSVLAQSIMRILPSKARLEAGRILFAPSEAPPVDLATLAPDGREMRAIRGGAIAMIFQEPMTAFSPVHTIGDQIGEVARLHRGLSRDRARAATIDVLGDVGFPEPKRKVDA
jgi:peptide/nickel transport system ATP-binding protein